MDEPPPHCKLLSSEPGRFGTDLAIATHLQRFSNSSESMTTCGSLSGNQTDQVISALHQVWAPKSMVREPLLLPRPVNQAAMAVAQLTYDKTVSARPRNKKK
jgi:hypothetical protein